MQCKPLLLIKIILRDLQSGQYKMQTSLWYKTQTKQETVYTYAISRLKRTHWEYRRKACESLDKLSYTFSRTPVRSRITIKIPLTSRTSADYKT